MSEILQKVSQYLFGPFSSWDGFVDALTRGPKAFIALESKTGMLYLFSGLIVALFVFWASRTQLREDQRGSFWKYVFPKSVYGHPSAIVDYKFVGFDLLIKFFLYIPFVLGVSQVTYVLFSKLSIDLSFSAFTNMNYVARIALVTLVSAAVVDFSVFFSHFLAHKIPFLWPFHEIHHSAEVLTPVTVHRVHPVEELTNGLVAGVFTGLLAGTYASMSGGSVEPYALFGLNIISFVYYLSVYQLRHSHIWLSFGPILSYIIVSPAQHQIHHSIDKKHWNKNYGFTFAIWDWMFGALYVPKEREEITFGVPDVEQSDFSTVRKLYLLPFVKSARRFKTMISSRKFKFDFDQIADPSRVKPDQVNSHESIQATN
ncbi:MAG: sterol desaturase family protein [Saprospiraceae bacterium]|nr:sterol desaturase family protein [Pyrinomonadaceae bacterium]